MRPKTLSRHSPVWTRRALHYFGGDIGIGRCAGGRVALADVVGAGVVPASAEGQKCLRCWQVLPEVGASSKHPGLCHRCEDAVEALPKVAA
jgi:isoleucyl-tRNA synthetase